MSGGAGGGMVNGAARASNSVDVTRCNNTAVMIPKAQAAMVVGGNSFRVGPPSTWSIDGLLGPDGKVIHTACPNAVPPQFRTAFLLWTTKGAAHAHNANLFKAVRLNSDGSIRRLGKPFVAPLMKLKKLSEIKQPGMPKKCGLGVLCSSKKFEEGAPLCDRCKNGGDALLYPLQEIPACATGSKIARQISNNKLLCFMAFMECASQGRQMRQLAGRGIQMINSIVVLADSLLSEEMKVAVVHAAYGIDKLDLFMDISMVCKSISAFSVEAWKSMRTLGIVFFKGNSIHALPTQAMKKISTRLGDANGRFARLKVDGGNVLGAPNTQRCLELLNSHGSIQATIILGGIATGPTTPYEHVMAPGMILPANITRGVLVRNAEIMTIDDLYLILVHTKQKGVPVAFEGSYVSCDWMPNTIFMLVFSWCMQQLRIKGLPACIISGGQPVLPADLQSSPQRSATALVQVQSAIRQMPRKLIDAPFPGRKYTLRDALEGITNLRTVLDCPEEETDPELPPEKRCRHSP